MKNLTVTAENFSAIREALKSRESVCVNGKVNLVSFEANTQRIAESGKVVRTPFYYVSEDGAKYTSVTLKQLLGIELETKGERKTTTFAAIWEQAAKLASDASDDEISDAIKTLQEIQKARKEAAEAKRKAEAEAEQSTLAALAKKYGFTLKAEAKPKAKRNAKK